MNFFTYYSSLYGQTYSRRWLKGCGPHLNSLLIKFIELALKSQNYKTQISTLSILCSNTQFGLLLGTNNKNNKLTVPTAQRNITYRANCSNIQPYSTNLHSSTAAVLKFSARLAERGATITCTKMAVYVQTWITILI
jgi:hypothetical protein